MRYLALSLLLVLPALDAKAEEIVLPPSQAEIDAFNACLRKGPTPCVLPTRTVIVPDDTNLLPEERMTPMPEREFYQSPPDELVNGRANTEMRESIRNAQGYQTYEWGIISTQDGPPEPFGSYSSDASRGDGASDNRGGSAPGSNGPGDGATGGGGGTNGNGGNGPSDPTDSGSDRSGGDRGGRPDRGEPNCER